MAYYQNIYCKKCFSTKVIKSGKVRGKQRYCCKKCGCHFVMGDERTEDKADLKALIVLLCALCKGKYQELGEFFWRYRSQAFRWAQAAGVWTPRNEGKTGQMLYAQNAEEVLDSLKQCRALEYRDTAIISGTIQDKYAVTVLISHKKY